MGSSLWGDASKGSHTNRCRAYSCNLYVRGSGEFWECFMAVARWAPGTDGLFSNQQQAMVLVRYNSFWQGSPCHAGRDKRGMVLSADSCKQQ